MTASRLAVRPKARRGRANAGILIQPLIPYIGNKRKLLGLIHQAIGIRPRKAAHSLISLLAAASCRAWPSCWLSGHRQRLGAVRGGHQPVLHRLQPARPLSMPSADINKRFDT